MIGDYAVVRTKGFVPWAIRAITRSKYNHAVVFVSDTEIVEAQPWGAQRTTFNYSEAEFSTGKLELTDEQRAAIATRAIAMIGIPYGFLDILSVGLLQYGIRPKFLREHVRREDRLICSQLVDVAWNPPEPAMSATQQVAHIYAEIGVHLFSDGRLPMDVTPGDLAKLLEPS